jgi:hypothetical protein
MTHKELLAAFDALDIVEELYRLVIGGPTVDVTADRKVALVKQYMAEHGEVSLEEPS